MYPGTYSATTPDKAAVIIAETGETVTYKELDDRSNQLAQLWYSYGLRAGDHVAILAENHARYFEVYWAAFRSGLYLTTINRYLSPEEAAYLVNDSNSTVLVASAAKAELAAEMLPLLTDCPHLLMFDGAVDGFESYEDAIAAMPAEQLAEQPRGDAMLYSSGTTGHPKGIKRPLSGLAVDDPGNTGIATLERFLMGMDENSVYLSPAPMYHSAPLMWSAGLHELGGTLVAMQKFDEARFLEFVEQYSITHSQLVPTMFVRMLKMPEEVRNRHDFSSLQAVVHAAAPCPVEVKQKMIDWWGPIVNEYYAGTEGNGLCWIAHKIGANILYGKTPIVPVPDRLKPRADLKNRALQG